MIVQPGISAAGLEENTWALASQGIQECLVTTIARPSAVALPANVPH